MDGLQMLDMVTNEPINDMQNLENQDEVEDLSIATDIEHGILDAGDKVKDEAIKLRAQGLCTYPTPAGDIYNLGNINFPNTDHAEELSFT